MSGRELSSSGDGTGTTDPERRARPWPQAGWEASRARMEALEGIFDQTRLFRKVT